MTINDFSSPAVIGFLTAWLFAGLAALPGVAQAQGNIRFSFAGYANPQRPFPGYVGEWQLGPVSIQGSGEIRVSDGAVVKGGQISHGDNLRDRRYPNHSTSWQVVRMLDMKTSGGRTELSLQVQVTGSNLAIICPTGTYGVLQLVNDNRRMGNGYFWDTIVTQMPNPYSVAPDGLAACRTHVHGFNNVDYDYTDPRRGGANGGIWAIVEISGGGCDVSGRWWHSTRGLPKTSLNFVRQNNGTYLVQEEGLARVSGPASFDIRSKTINWRFRHNNKDHTSVWTLNANCTSSVSGGTHGGTPSTLTRQ